MKTVTLILPYPPSVNHMYGRTKYGGTFKTKKAKAFESDVRAMVIERGIRPFLGAVKVEVVAFFPDRRKRDVSNIEKCIGDALEEFHGFGCYENDRQIVDCQLVKAIEIHKGGKVIVRVTEVKNHQTPEWAEVKE
jgi:crossover junction endodeoxyribonuclease RusA